MQIVISSWHRYFKLSEDAKKYICNAEGTDYNPEDDRWSEYNHDLRSNKYLLEYIKLFGLSSAADGECQLRIKEIPDEYVEFKAYEIEEYDALEWVRLDKYKVKVGKAKKVLDKIKTFVETSEVHEDLRSLVSNLDSIIGV